MTLFVCFCASWYSALLAVFVQWTSMVGVLWDSVVWSLWSPCLDALSLLFLLFVWALLLYLGFTCWCLLCLWVLPSIRLTNIQRSYVVLYAVVQVLVNKAVLPDNLCQQTYASKKNPCTTSAMSTTIELRWIKVRRDRGYYKIWQREYEMTKRGDNVIEW